jgi:hypothetical protein
MAKPLAYRLGQRYARLTPLWRVVVALAPVLVLFVVVSLINRPPETDDSPTGQTSGTAAGSGSSCTALAQADIDKAVSGWTGNGTLTVGAARKAQSNGSDVFSEVWFIAGTAPGVDEVFVFANEPGGLLVGADFLTREFFDWGAAASGDSPMAQEARAAANAAPECL